MNKGAALSDNSIYISPGMLQPLGATMAEDGVNFAIYSKHATAVTLCLYSSEDQKNLLFQIPLMPTPSNAGKVWHIFVHNIPLNLLYTYRIHGDSSFLPASDETALNLLDPYAKAVATGNTWGRENFPYSPLGVILSEAPFDWGLDASPQIPSEDLIIYEMHVRGFTRHRTSGTANPGTFLGLIEKIPHLIKLGINAVQLMPMFEFNECEYERRNPVNGKRLYNYWGYSHVSFFAPMQRYVVGEQQHAGITEFKTMVKALHNNGIEVILDVVYNHTAEGNGHGPILSFKGIDNNIYYLLDNQGNYLNFTGCGNTVNCNHPVVEQLILDSLRFWVTEMHVDGFRFDLTSIFTRGPQEGRPLAHPPILEAIAHDPVLSRVKLIAEPWDAAGLYQLGFFAAQYHCWSEWNGRFRDMIRRFIRGGGGKGQFITNLCGSEDLYYSRTPTASINFITAHDGFTLSDLVSYNQKHNLENGEENRDGLNWNESWNCGAEGITNNKKVLQLRERQMRNLHLALMLSRGIPMLLMGDEYGHTKKGNNNTWCQDNELNWFLWDHLKKNEVFFRFYRALIHFRRQHPILHKNSFFTNQNIEWHGIEPFKPNWEPYDTFVAFVIKNPELQEDIYVAFNAGPEFAHITLPYCEIPGKKWHWVVNTASPSPYDFREEEARTPIIDLQYRMQPYSAILLKTL